MKRRILSFMIVFILIATMSTAALALRGDRVEYSDSESGISFTMPKNWYERSRSTDGGINIMYSLESYPELYIEYTSYDIWGNMPSSSQSTTAREDINNSFISKAGMAKMSSIPADDVQTKKFNKQEYFYVGSDTATVAVKYEYGYMFIFAFNRGSGNEHFGDFEDMLKSVKYANSSSSSSSSVSPGVSIFIGLIITIIIYSLPIIIYRYFIRKSPVEKKTGILITLAYAFVALLVMSLLKFTTTGSGVAGSAITFWSFINYTMLVGGKKVTGDSSPASAYVSTTPSPPVSTAPSAPVIATASNTVIATPPAPVGIDERYVAPQAQEHPETAQTESSYNDQILYCHKCGFKLQEDSVFCSRCGTKIPRSD